MQFIQVMKIAVTVLLWLFIGSCKICNTANAIQHRLKQYSIFRRIVKFNDSEDQKIDSYTADEKSQNRRKWCKNSLTIHHLGEHWRERNKIIIICLFIWNVGYIALFQINYLSHLNVNKEMCIFVTIIINKLYNTKNNKQNYHSP